MAVSNELVAIVVAMLLLYFWGMDGQRERWIRMIASAGFIAAGLTLVIVGDNVPMFMLFGVTVIIGGIQLFRDVTSLVGSSKSEW